MNIKEYQSVVLDCFAGSGTTCRVAYDLGRKYLGVELNPEFLKLAEKRMAQQDLIDFL
jgi:site-specific DNA-methyltransferase (adenine-specific)